MRLGLNCQWSKKLQINKCTLIISRNRVVNNWNKLPTEMVNGESINDFKNLFDKPNK